MCQAKLLFHQVVQKQSDNFAKSKFMFPGYFVAKQALAGLQIFAVRLEYPVALEGKRDRRLMQC